MGSSNSKKDQTEDFYFAETVVSRISTQYQTERKIGETKDVFVQNLSQESTPTDNFSTFIPSTKESIKESIKRMHQNRRPANDELDSDGMDSDDSYDWESDEPKQNISLEKLSKKSTLRTSTASNVLIKKKLNSSIAVGY